MTDATTEAQIQEWIKQAAEVETVLTRDDFKVIDGYPTLDGMDPDEWLEAMSMD